MLLLEKYYQNCPACFGCSECEWVKGDHTQITTIHKQLVIEIRQNMLKQCHWNYIEVIFQLYMLEIENYPQKHLCVLRVGF